MPDKIVWYHVHPSREIIDTKFKRKSCKPPTTWTILPSSADFSWFLERARKYYGANPNGEYVDRVVVYPLGVTELSLTEEGKAVIHQFKWVKNYSTQEDGNVSMPGFRIWPQRALQGLTGLMNRIAQPGDKLDDLITRVMHRLSTKAVRVRFIPMRQFD